MNLKLLVPAALLLASAANADEGFSGEASAGFINTSGNTSTRTLNSKVEGKYQARAWAHLVNVSALTAQRDKITTDERYSVGYKLSRDFTAHDYVFASMNYDNDRFAGVIVRTTEAFGYGRRLLARPAHTLDAELGAGATQQKRLDGMRDHAVVGLINVKYQWRITETSSFSQATKVEHSKDNTFINPVSALKLVIAGQLFTTLGYEVRINTSVPATTRKTDTLTSINLGYAFGKGTR